jgi:hypothetical protein
MMMRAGNDAVVQAQTSLKRGFVREPARVPSQS